MDVLNGIGDALVNLNDLPRIALSLALVAVAGIISRWQQADLEKDLFVASVRSFIQLIAIRLYRQ